MSVLAEYMHTGLYGPDCPALVCNGTADPWSTEPVTAEIASCLRRPEWLTIDGVGHLPNLEAEQQFNQELLAFLKGCAGHEDGQDRHLMEQPALGRCGSGTGWPARVSSMAERRSSPVTGLPFLGVDWSNAPR